MTLLTMNRTLAHASLLCLMAQQASYYHHIFCTKPLTTLHFHPMNCMLCLLWSTKLAIFHFLLHCPVLLSALLGFVLFPSQRTSWPLLHVPQHAVLYVISCIIPRALGCFTAYSDCAGLALYMTHTHAVATAQPSCARLTRAAYNSRPPLALHLLPHFLSGFAGCRPCA